MCKEIVVYSAIVLNIVYVIYVICIEVTLCPFLLHSHRQDTAFFLIQCYLEIRFLSLSLSGTGGLAFL